MNQKVLLVSLNDEKDSSISRSFEDQGYEVSHILNDFDSILSHLKLDKNIKFVVVSIQSPRDSYFEGLKSLISNNPIPVVVFSKSSTRKFTEEAATIGLGAYIVDGFVPERIPHIMDLAKARFKEFQAMKSELEKTKSSLAERKVIEKAKGILMRRKTIDEESAFKIMRKMAMDKNQKLADIASNIISADTLLS